MQALIMLMAETHCVEMSALTMEKVTSGEERAEWR